MAYVIRPNNIIEVVHPTDPAQGFSLDELQRFVGEGTPTGRGYIEPIAIPASRFTMYGNEDAKGLGLPRNTIATALAQFATPREVGAFIARAQEQGVNMIFDPAILEEPDYVAGTVIVLGPGEEK